ncbi:disulfide bond formation protein B [Peribacillus simplex]|uniref:disulfide bond formation protein B n=1 Tax=Peribacillus simplex TaxID=1478 RepID=UPI0032E43731
MGKRNHEQDYLQLGKLIYCGLGCSTIAMFGSFHFSGIKQNEPFALCWYQRITTYPFTIILGIAIIRKDHWICFYTMIVTAIGAYISISLFSKGFILSRPHPCMRKGSMYRTIYKRIGFITITF